MKNITAKEINLAICILFFAKALAFGVSTPECLGLFVVLLFIQAEHIVSHLYPKRVDLHTEFALMSARVGEIQTKLDEQERDLTAIKFGNVRGGR